MAAPGLAGQLLRPEWLFEVVNRVQGLAAPPAGFCAPPNLDEVFEIFQPESDLEQQLKHHFLARLKTEQAVYTSAPAAAPPVTSSVDAAGEITPKSARVRAAVARAQWLLQSDLVKHWTVGALARRVGCNRTDLEEGFRRECSCTVHGYLVICRVEAAKVVLRKTAWRLEEVAKAAGFRSKVSLYEHFRRVLGMTPNEYRRRWTLVAASYQVQALFSSGYRD